MLDYSTVSDEQREQATKWIGGFALPIVLVAYGLTVLAADHATIWTRYRFFSRQTIELDGFDAELYGMALIVGAAAAHLGFFWRNHERYWQVGEIGLAIAGVVWAVLALWLVARQFINFV